MYGLKNQVVQTLFVLKFACKMSGTVHEDIIAKSCLTNQLQKPINSQTSIELTGGQLKEAFSKREVIILPCSFESTL